jgi:colanic acid/amylovoran biosynthesis glycosyltransferase
MALLRSPAEPRASTIGYLVPEWPAQTHAFFWRELSALRAMGDTVHLLSTRTPLASACRHDFAAEARRSTHYLFPPRTKSALRVLLAHPTKTLAALAHVRALNESSPKERARILALLPCAADLVAVSQELGIEHVHIHSCANAAHLGALSRLLGGPSYSLTLHGDLPVYGVDHARKMAHSAFVSTVTEPLRAQVAQVDGMAHKPIPVITMGVDVDKFTPRTSYGEPNKLLLATVARLARVKGHGYVLEAVHRARQQGLDVRYAIAGDGEQRPEIERQVAKLGLGDVVELLGTLSEPDVRSLLQRADAFVLASEGLGEAAPVSLMEAMASGMPVICSRIGGTADMISDRVDGFLVEQRDVTGITQAVVELARDLALRQRLGEAARARAVSSFDYRVTAGKLRSAIANAIAG